MLRTIVRTAVGLPGLVPAIRFCKRKGCRILVYHRFPADRSRLAAQCEYIRRNFQPVSMRQVADSLSGGPPLPNYAVAVTIDDGYRDFLLNAQPVFSQYGIPVTVFVISGFIDRELWPWWDQITYMIHRTRRTTVSFAGGELNLADNLVRVIDVVTTSLKRLPAKTRHAKINDLQQNLDVHLPEYAPAEYEPLSWEDVRQLSSSGVEFGAHTRTHPILSLVSDEAELAEEIAGSKRRLDEQLGISSLHFAYPNGTPVDYDERTVAFVQQSGFATAVVVDRSFNYRNADPFRLARLDADPSLSRNYLMEALAGLPRF